MKPEYHIVIPARLASERLPRKPLLEIAGRPLIEHVYRRALAAAARSVVIATDSGEIAEAARGFGAQVVLTSPEHQSGSDRIAECASTCGWGGDTLLVNLQGDEPLMPAACLDQVAALLAGDTDADVASLYWPVRDAAEAADPNGVKVVVDRMGRALYFSRAAIPFPRGSSEMPRGGWKRHVGLYAYRVNALRSFTGYAPGVLEQVEKLEQLRFLENGHRIAMAEAAEAIPGGVDTAEDLERVRRVLEPSR